MKLWLDDDRPPPGEDWLWAKTVDEAFLFYIEGFAITHISLDHDLGKKEDGSLEPTGYDFVCQIERQIGKGGWWHPIPTFVIHSENSVGRKNMQAAIDSIERMR